MKINCLDIFYNEIIKEAAKGRVDCFFYRNVLFNTNIENNLIEESNYNITLKPTLMIKNKKKFDEKLLNYVLTASSFYKKYEPDMEEKDYLKEIMTVIWSNATVEDFNNPDIFLEKRTKMIKDNCFDCENKKIGQIFNLDILMSRKKESILKETPYILEFKIGNNTMPVIRYGIVDEKVYIYAIQNENKTDLEKGLKRNLYKLKSGFNEELESHDNEKDFENLTGITPSFMASLTLALGQFNKVGLNDIEVIGYLPVRLNAKEILKEIKLSRNNELDINKLNENIEKETRNETDKFIRHFRRLEKQFTGLEITSLPMDFDTSLHLKLKDGSFSNNNLENLYYNKEEQKKIK